MKTPQQIKDEVEKEIERKQIDVDGYSENTYWGKEFRCEMRLLQAQLSILTEYDKSIKEMIEVKVLTDWRGQNEFIDWLNKQTSEEKQDEY